MKMSVAFDYRLHTIAESVDYGRPLQCSIDIL